jgi:hypothetical protein
MRLLFINNATFSTASFVQELDRLLPIEHLYLIDHLPPSPIGGVEMSYFSMIGMQQGEHFEAGWTKIPPLDAPTLSAMSECETIFLKAIEKNGKFSKLIDREQRRRKLGLPPIDQYATGIGYDQRKYLYLQHLRYWKYFLEHNDIDLVTITISPHHGYDYVIYRLAKLLKIPVLFYEDGPVDDWMIPKDDIEEPDNRIKRAVAAAREAFATTPENVSLSERADGFVKKLTNRNEDPTPYYMDPARIASWEYAPVATDWKTAKSLARGVLSFCKNYGLGGERRVAARLLLFCWVVRWRKERELRQLRTYYDSLASAPDFGRPSIYLPLHYQPEISTSPLAGVFAEQLLVAQMLSYCLPDRWQINVKEHPYQKSLARDAALYRELSRLPNVRLVSRDINTYTLIDEGSAVATCTGRAGWEALFRGKPVLAFGEVSFQYAPGAFRVRSLDDCKAAMAKIAAGADRPTHHELMVFLKGLESIAVRGNLAAGSPAQLMKLAGITPYELGVNMARDVAVRYQERRPDRVKLRRLGS